jgi:uncharacterized protein YbjT (DUF2867 family)
MERLDAVHQYDAVLAIDSVPNYLLDEARMVRLFACFRQALRPGGLVVLDIWNMLAQWAIIDRPITYEKRHGETVITFRELHHIDSWQSRMHNLVTITGATGNIGKALADRLLHSGVTIRAVARHAERLLPLTAQGAEARVGDMAHTFFLTEAFRGADAVFAMIPPHHTAPDLRAYHLRIAASLAEALHTAGMPRVVALSSNGASLPSGTGPIADLHTFEERLQAIPGLSVVALRPTLFMEDQLASIPLIRSAGINGSAARADVALAMIATRDIAAVAAEYLLAPTFEGYMVRDLLGPRDYTHREATAILGAAIGKPDLAYVELSYEDFRQGLLRAGFSASAADAYVEMYTAINAGRMQSIVRRNALNTTPITLEAFAREVFAPAYEAS